jgi:DNA ligase-1
MTLLWKPLLSGTLPIDPVTGDFDYSLILFPVYASPKEDGFRAMVQRSVLVSRNGLPVRNKELQARYGRKEYEGLDGELTDGPPNGEDVFHRTSKIVTKADADASDVRFNIIDYYLAHGSLKDLHARIDDLKSGDHIWHAVTIIPQMPIETVNQLKKFEVKCLTQGFEGVMLRRADQGVYPQKPGKENRSTLREFYLVRMKRFEPAEAIITAVHPLKHNANEERTGAGKRSSKKAGIVVDASRVGSATLRDIKTGKAFYTTIGAEKLRNWSGWKDKKRWFGVTVRYKYQLVGTVDKPRINTCSFSELGAK